MLNNENVLFLLGPTNTGKTYYAIEKMLTYSSGVIGLPLRLLAREVYDKVVKKIGKLKVALITGEEQIVPQTAKYFVTTVEAMPSEKYFEFLAVDEIQLCSDFERGHIFTDRLLNSRGTMETLFLGSDSMEKILKNIFSKPKIFKKKRRSKLSFIGKKGLFSLPKRSAIIAFNSNDVYSIASKIKKVKGGAAVVMGSLSPQTRNSQVKMFEEGTVDYIVATDAIGMGLNLKIKNVSFSSLNKFDGKENRALKKNEIGQICGRAGRNNLEGSFSTTLECRPLYSETIKAVENHIYDPNEFLYWRESTLDFSSIYYLIKSLEKKSNDPRLVKTQNHRDENTLKYLSSLSLIKDRLKSEQNVKLLWDISLIPDYFKNLDSIFTELLVRIFCNIIDNGMLNTSWAIYETKKLQDLEGTIDMLTFRLAKTRFWNYISNKKHWTNNNQDLKNLALDTERMLSDALHDRLTNEFVEKKIKQFISEFTSNKAVNIRIEKGNAIFLNEKAIGHISGFQVKIIDEKSIFKNKFLKNKISEIIKRVIKNYAEDFLAKKNLNLTFDKQANLFLDSHKVGSIYKGESIYNPKIIINNNNYLSKSMYVKIVDKVSTEIQRKINTVFWEKDTFALTQNRKLKTFLFAINKNHGVVHRDQIETAFIPNSPEERNFLLGKGIFLGRLHFFYKNLINNKDREIRWILGCLYFNGKVLDIIPDKTFISNLNNIPEKLLNIMGYVKVKNIAVKIIFLEKVLKRLYDKKKRVFCFNNIVLQDFKVTHPIFSEILVYLNFEKIAGTENVSFWIKKKKSKSEKKKYNKDSPFYILKKLQ